MIIKPKVNVIVLVGLSGSGKSSLGLALSQELNFSFIDTDECIAQGEGKSIVQLFKEEGEAYFRQIEKELVLNLDLTSPTILALGGGAWIQEEIRGFLIPVASIFYLETNVESILQRLENNDSRPLLNDLGARKEVLEQQLETRKTLYAQSTITVDANAAISEIVQEIIRKLQLD